MDSKRTIEALPGASTTKTFHTQNKTPKTLLVHPFSNPTEKTQNDTKEKTKNKTYLLETPKDLKRKTPLLELPRDFTKKPKLYNQEANNEHFDKNNSIVPANTNENSAEMNNSDQQSDSHQSDSQSDTANCHHCCCSKNCRENSKSELNSCCQTVKVSDNCSCQSQAVKVIFAPAMLPSIFGPMPGIPYILKTPAKANDKVSGCIVYKYR